MREVSFALLICSLFLNSCNTNKNVVKSNIDEIVKKEEVNYIPYYLKVNEADSLHLIGNFKKSQHILDSLFNKFEPLNQESYGEYITYLKNRILLNDLKNVDKVLKRAYRILDLK